DHNHSDASGGAIANLSGALEFADNAASLTVINSTLYANSADGAGGAISNFVSLLRGLSATALITSSTLSHNTASFAAGAIYNSDSFNKGAANLTLRNTIFDHNSIDNSGGSVTSGGYNLSSGDGG